MICPVCHTEIPEGSNICPHCYADLIKTQQNRYHKPAKSGGPVKINPQALIVAGGLFIVLLVLVIVLVRFMFSGDSTDPTQQQQQQQPGSAQVQPSPEQTQFAVFGEPIDVVVTTPEPVQPQVPVPTPTPAPTAEPAYVSLKKGDRSDQVKQVQTALVALGYLTDKADGIFGANTETAVKAFQKANNLKDDGIAGQQTQSALFKQYYSSGAAQPQAQVQTQAPVPNEQVPNLPG